MGTELWNLDDDSGANEQCQYHYEQEAKVYQAQVQPIGRQKVHCAATKNRRPNIGLSELLVVGVGFE